jgi:DNA-binding PadR family transcriptional regulator
LGVKFAILAILERRSMHGYELRRELEIELGPEWAVNYGQIYSTLERLSRHGLVVQSETVTSAEAPDRKLYTITPAGRGELRRWFLTALPGPETSRDELHAKIVLGLTGDVDVADVIQVQRKAELRRIGELTARKERLDPHVELPAVLQLDLAILKTEAVIRWLDSAEAKIRNAAEAGATGVQAGATVEPTAGESADEPVREEETR